MYWPRNQHLFRRHTLPTIYLYLSQKIADEKARMRRDELVDIIRNRSVVTWKHINLQGEYDFSEEKLKDSRNNWGDGVELVELFFLL